MSRKKKNLKITKEQLHKMEKKSRRDAELEAGGRYSPSNVHQTSKKDLLDKESNDIKTWEE